MRGVTILIAALISLLPAVSGAAEMPALVSRWYEALRTADAEGFSALLPEDAKVELKDLGIVQSKAEFVESMDAWAEAIEGGSIETKVQEAGPGSVTVDVCYRFPGNQQRNREIFAIAGDRIAGVVQEAVAADCNGF